jgi:hypothetical protein
MLVVKIILGILLFIFILLLIPLKVNIRYAKEFNMMIKYGFITIFKIPTEGKKKAKKEKKPEKEKKKSKINIKDFIQKNGINKFLKIIQKIIKMASSKIGAMMKHIKIEELDVYICVSAEDAATAAITYGEISAAVYSSYSMIASLSKPHKGGVSVDLDYDKHKTTAVCDIDLHIMPIFIVINAIPLIKQVMPYIKILLKNEVKDGNKDE